MCARAKKGGCGTEKAHSKCLKLKQNGGDIDIDKPGVAKAPATTAPPAKPPPPSNSKDKKRKR